MYDKELLLKHWKKHHLEAIPTINSCEEMINVALDLLKSMPQPVEQVSGPISTGGKGSIQENLKLFEKVNLKLMKEGKNIFYVQIPFEEAIIKIRKNWNLPTYESNQRLLDEFYSKIFESGLIKRIHFMHGWQSSHGASWERKKAEELGIEIVDLPEHYSEEE
jgi:hypothetical protein